MARRWGLPYMGSKNKIVDKIVDAFPKCFDNFYDLFCGGCAITDYVSKNNIYKNCFANDIDRLPVELYKNALQGNYKNETRWISREDFNSLKETDCYVKYCWSFGNNGRGYLYGKEIESYKKAFHYAVIFNDFSFLDNLFKELSSHIKEELDGVVDVKERRILFGRAVKRHVSCLGGGAD